MQQVVVLNTEEKGLFAQVGRALYGPQITDKAREIIGVAPAPRTDEELAYRVAERDMPTHVWPAFELMRDWGYARNDRRDNPEEGEVMRVDGSILDLLMSAIKQVLEALLGGGSAGAPPTGPTRTARPSRRGSLLIEHDGSR